jgi:hypothetical protein
LTLQAAPGRLPPRLNGGRQLRIPLEAGYDGELFEVGALG